MAEKQRIAKFHKVSWEQFRDDMKDAHPALTEDKIRERYESLKLPRRGTTKSAGYDFFSPVNITLIPGQSARIPTGIRAQMDEDWALLLFPRSGLGFKYRLQLANTVGIIDADYFDSSNEGHIMIKITNDSKEEKVVKIEEGMSFAQGIFMPYGITEDDDAKGIRDGGFGSTGV